MNNLPDFFENRTEPWHFADVVDFIRENFEVKENFAFRIGELANTKDQNQKAAIVLAYSQMMNFTFGKVKSLFSEHDHFAIAMPETRKGRNIVELNKIYVEILQKGNPQDSRINDFPEYFDIPDDVLVLKSNN